MPRGAGPGRGLGQVVAAASSPAESACSGSPSACPYRNPGPLQTQRTGSQPDLIGTHKERVFIRSGDKNLPYTSFCCAWNLTVTAPVMPHM